jgi:hypothetical protein
MKNTHNDISSRADDLLEGYLEEAIGGGADRITFEYVPEGLATCFMVGGIGARRILRDYELGTTLMQHIGAKLDKQSPGTLTWKILGKPVTFAVEEYDSFGECAFRFTLKSDAGVRTTRAAAVR